jgi:hypothetical protein
MPAEGMLAQPPPGSADAPRKPTPNLNIDKRNEIARGYILIGVFIMHLLFPLANQIGDPSKAPIAFALLKLFQPHVPVFFLLSGMSSRALGKRSLHSVLQQSFMLVLLCLASQAVGIVIANSLYGGYGTGSTFIKALIKPAIFGVDWASFLPWFFMDLALIRVLAWLYERNKIHFLIACLVLAGLVLLSYRLHHLNNWYEWRNWPLLTVLFLIGMKLPKAWQVSPGWGLSAGAGAALLTWFNVPNFFSTIPCLTCNLAFVVNLYHGPRPDGSMGTVPVYFAAEMLLLVFALWAAQSPPELIGNFARFFGRLSLQAVLLEGWWMAFIDQYFWRHEPSRVSFLTLAGIIVLSPLGHGLALKFLEPWLTGIIMACSKASKAALSKNFWLGLPFVQKTVSLAACSRPSALLAVACIVLHLLANGHYGFLRDELYFIVCGQRPAWGYFDQPAGLPLLAAWSHDVFGNFLLGFRTIPALSLSAAVALTAELARALGGGRFSQWLAGSCVLLGPVFLFLGVILTTSVFEPLTWLGLAWVLVRLEQSGDERWWLAFGAIAGLSLNCKYIIAFYVIALAFGLLATRQRKSFLHPWIYLGALLAAALALPNIMWQYAHHWPFLELVKVNTGAINIRRPLPGFILQEIILTGPLAAVVWLSGLWAGTIRPKLGIARAFPIAWLIVVAFVDHVHGKPYYCAGIYPILLALGAVRIEEWIRNEDARGAVLGSVIAIGALMAPLTLPILPVKDFIRYQQAVGFMPSTGTHARTGILPDYYADMFGWPQIAAQVAAVYRSLPPRDREKAVFLGANYGEAAAVDVFDRNLGLPPAISGHNNYYFWGPLGHDGSVVIAIGDMQQWTNLFRSVEIAGRVDAPYASPYEQNQPILVLRDMKIPLADYWPKLKVVF